LLTTWLLFTESGAETPDFVFRLSATPFPVLLSVLVVPALFDFPRRNVPPVAAAAVPPMAKKSAT
jgi:hypothetical protein